MASAVLSRGAAGSTTASGSLGIRVRRARGAIRLPLSLPAAPGSPSLSGTGHTYPPARKTAKILGFGYQKVTA